MKSQCWSAASYIFARQAAQELACLSAASHMPQVSVMNEGCQHQANANNFVVLRQFVNTGKVKARTACGLLKAQKA